MDLDSLKGDLRGPSGGRNTCEERKHEWSQAGPENHLECTTQQMRWSKTAQLVGCSLLSIVSTWTLPQASKVKLLALVVVYLGGQSCVWLSLESSLCGIVMLIMCTFGPVVILLISFAFLRDLVSLQALCSCSHPPQRQFVTTSPLSGDPLLLEGLFFLAPYKIFLFLQFWCTPGYHSRNGDDPLMC